MKKLLFITSELPYPPRSGGRVKSLRLLDSLAQRYAVTIVSPLKGDDASHLAEFRERSSCAAHLHREVQVPRSASRLLASYLRRRPLNVHRTFDAGLAEQVQRIAGQFDVIFIDHYEAGVYLPADYRGLVVYHAHNAYHQLWQRFARLPGNIALRAAALAEARRVRSAERAIARRAELVFASPNDADALVAMGIPADKIARTYHLGDDSQLQLPSLKFDADRKQLMYVGFLGWEANAAGLLWFIENVWPRLLQEQPDLRFDIAGKDPDQRLIEQCAIYPGIRILGFVEDLETVYSGADISVAPLLFGSGMKVKVLDAMARGIPTVTTQVGAEGIDYLDGEHLSVARNAADMAERILALLNDQQAWERLASGGRALIAERYTWAQLLEDMHRQLARALQAKNAARTAPVTATEALAQNG